MANDEILARLVGHAFGDGSIHCKKQYFIYTNSNNILQKRVKSMVTRVFGRVKYSIGTSIGMTPRYQYSNKVGKVLAQRGAPIGSKVLQRTQVPIWIFNGNKRVRAAFLGALFDDEGYFRNTSDSRQIAFKTAKISNKRRDLEGYLEQLIQMLNSLDIKTSGIRSDQLKYRKDGKEIISLRFWITGKENLKKFSKSIMLFHPEKEKKMLKMWLSSGEWRRRSTRTHPTVSGEG